MLKKLKVEGKERPFLICVPGMMELDVPLPDGTETDEQIREIGVQNIEEIAFSGFKYGALYQDQEVDFTKKDVKKWLMIDMELWPDMLDAYRDAQPVLEKVQKKMKQIEEKGGQNGQKADTNMNRQQRRKASQKSN